VAEDIEYVRGQLDNEAFVENAPDEVVQQERDKLESYLEERERLEASLEQLEALRGAET
jgi:valyl-tRNA synthetase